MTSPLSHAAALPTLATAPLTRDDVRAELARHRISGQEIAAAAGCSPAMVSLVLSGTRASERVAQVVGRLIGLDASVLRTARQNETTRQGPPAGSTRERV